MSDAIQRRMSMTHGRPRALLGRAGSVTGGTFRRKVRTVPRRGYIAVIAAIRLMNLSRRADLTNQESLQTRALFYSLPAMSSYPAITEALSSAGLSVGTEELMLYLDRVEYQDGRVLTLHQFELLMMQLKKKFIKDGMVPDSEVAFVALGGAEDLGGEVSADDLRSVCRTFRLTIDIDKFIEEHDDDGSGLLEFEEFDAMFRKAAAGDGNVPPPAAARSVINPTVLPTLTKRAADLSPTDEEVMEESPRNRAGEGNAEGETADTPKSLFESITQWGESVPPAFRSKKDKKKSKKKSTASDTDAGSERRDSGAQTTRHNSKSGKAGGSAKHNSSNNGEPQSARPSSRPQRLLWESGKEESAKKGREEAKLKVAEGSSFGGSSRRFSSDGHLAPLPPAKGSATPRPIRPHPRDQAVDIASLVAKLRQEDAAAAANSSHHSSPRGASRGTERVGTAGSLPSIQRSGRRPKPPSSQQQKKRPTRWYAYNPFAQDAKDDVSADPLTQREEEERQARRRRARSQKRKKSKAAADEEKVAAKEEEPEEEEAYEDDDDSSPTSHHSGSHRSSKTSSAGGAEGSTRGDGDDTETAAEEEKGSEAKSKPSSRSASRSRTPSRHSSASSRRSSSRHSTPPQEPEERENDATQEDDEPKKEKVKEEEKESHEGRHESSSPPPSTPATAPVDDSVGKEEETPERGEESAKAEEKVDDDRPPWETDENDDNAGTQKSSIDQSGNNSKTPTPPPQKDEPEKTPTPPPQESETASSKTPTPPPAAETSSQASKAEEPAPAAADDDEPGWL